MARVDRRQKLALDEAYRYYRQIEISGAEPSIFKLTKALRTLSTALAFADTGEFKLTRQLWKRLYQSLFYRLVTSYPGSLSVYSGDNLPLKPGGPLPEDGFVQFVADGCKRADDTAKTEVSRLFPRIFSVFSRVWQAGLNRVTPEDFAKVSECQNGVCMTKPFVVGDEKMSEEALTAKHEAYNKWWELYWQAYCAANNQERTAIRQHMSELEAVWGDLYY
jgi:hypothetical protein